MSTHRSWPIPVSAWHFTRKANCIAPATCLLPRFTETKLGESRGGGNVGSEGREATGAGRLPTARESSCGPTHHAQYYSTPHVLLWKSRWVGRRSTRRPRCRRHAPSAPRITRVSSLADVCCSAVSRAAQVGSGAVLVVPAPTLQPRRFATRPHAFPSQGLLPVWWCWVCGFSCSSASFSLALVLVCGSLMILVD